MFQLTEHMVAFTTKWSQETHVFFHYSYSDQSTVIFGIRHFFVSVSFSSFVQEEAAAVSHLMRSCRQHTVHHQLLNKVTNFTVSCCSVEK